VAVAATAPVACAWAWTANRRLPSFASLIGGAGERRGRLAWILGGTLMVVVLLAIQAALGLVFDPRYRDIPFAPLTAAVLPFLVLSLSAARLPGLPAMAERAAATLLALSAVYIALNETFANWQAIWFSSGLLALSLTLLRARAVPD
jgi:glucan 1,3-beta-glucosidase